MSPNKAYEADRWPGIVTIPLRFVTQRAILIVMNRKRLEMKRVAGPTTSRADDAPLLVRRPGRPRSDAVHGAILDATVALIREVGYDVVTMEAIAARAGAGKATLYRRWDSKEELVAEAIQRLMSDAMRVPDTGTTVGDVRKLMRVTQGMYGDPATPMLLSGLVAAMARSDRIARTVRSSFVGSWRSAMRAVLSRGIARGDLRSTVGLDLALDLLAGPPFHRALIGGRRIDERFMRNVIEVVLRGLAP